MTMPASQPVDYVQVCEQIAGFLDREFSATVVTEVGDLHALATQLRALRECAPRILQILDMFAVTDNNSKDQRACSQAEAAILALTHINPRDAHG